MQHAHVQRLNHICQLVYPSELMRDGSYTCRANQMTHTCSVIGNNNKFYSVLRAQILAGA